MRTASAAEVPSGTGQGPRPGGDVVSVHTGLNVEAVGAIEGYASAAHGAFPAARDSRDADPLAGPKGAAFGSIFDNPGRLVARVGARFRMEFATTDGADLDADERFGSPARRHRDLN